MRLITWLDASGGTGSWEHIENFQEKGPIHCQSVGFVVHETDEYVTIVQNLDGEEETKACHHMVIPQMYVKKSRVLK